VTAGGQPVTSTRIRGLVAAGDVAQATRLLGRPTRVSGTVRRGRGEGASLGFPTANVAPVAFAALPADGVYAGVAVLADDREFPCAISVGAPPMFPHAKDHLEAHLIGFDGDLYDAPLTLEFLDRLRGQHSYPTLDDLAAAIAADTRRALEIVGSAEHGLSTPDRLADGSLVVDNPAALDAAERAVRFRDPGPTADDHAAPAEGWAFLLHGLPFDRRRLGAIDGALVAVDIDHVWQPYDPHEAPLLRLGVFGTERFAVSVRIAELEAARALLESLENPES
jgi:Riboflavin kinase